MMVRIKNATLFIFEMHTSVARRLIQSVNELLPIFEIVKRSSFSWFNEKVEIGKRDIDGNTFQSLLMIIVMFSVKGTSLLYMFLVQLASMRTLLQ